MSYKILRATALSNLRNDIAENLTHYRKGDFHFVFAESNNTFDVDITVNESLISAMKPSNDSMSEVVNSSILFKAIDNLTPYLARDERLWASMTHSILLEYSRNRWPIPADDESAINHIAMHFFAKSKRDIERNNAASRLWWLAELCNRVKDLSLDEALTCLTQYADVRANIIERPTISQCVNVFSALIKKLYESHKADGMLLQRKTFRSLMKKLNLYGGIKLLDAMDEKSIMGFIEESMKG